MIQREFYGSEPAQFGDLFLPAGDGAHPVAIVLHGGLWFNAYSLDQMTPMCAALADAGIAAWNVEYRRIGDPGGRFPGTFHDVARATDHLRELAPKYHLDLTRVIALGHSAGGHLALWIAARAKIPVDDPLHTSAPLAIRATVSLAGIGDLQLAWQSEFHDVIAQFIGGAPDDAPERYAVASPAALLPLGVKQILIHGEDDELVPIEMSRAYQSAASACGDDASLVPLSDAGHFQFLDPRTREWATVLQIVKRVLEK